MVTTIIESIQKLTSQLETNDNALSYQEYNSLLTNINELGKTLYNRQDILQTQVKDRIEEISDVMANMSKCNFTSEAPISEEGDYIDSFAEGLNMLSYHLKKEFESLSKYKRIIEYDTDAKIICDENDTIKFINKIGFKVCDFDLSFVERKMSDLLQSQSLQERFVMTLIDQKNATHPLNVGDTDVQPLQLQITQTVISNDFILYTLIPYVRTPECCMKFELRDHYFEDLWKGFNKKMYGKGLWENAVLNSIKKIS